MFRKSLKNFLPLCAAIALLLNTSQSLAGAPKEPPLQPEYMDSAAPILYMASPLVSDFHVPTPQGLNLETPATATFMITFLENTTNKYGDYCNSWPAEVRTVFNHAASVWATQVNSTVPIVISACWTELSPGVLGYSGAAGNYKNFIGAPQTGTWYSVALANTLAKADLNGTDPEINVAFSRTFPWYLGIDGSTPGNKYDLESVILHEIGHGLNFAGSMVVSGSLGYWGWMTYPEPSIYDRFTENGSDQTLLTFANGSTELKTQLTGGSLYFDGPHARAANGGTPAKIFAPGTWQQGSSYSHLDEIYNNTINSLMTYSLDFGESNHNPGPVMLGVMQDLGWTVQVSNTSPMISGLPDLIVPANNNSLHAIDLWSFTWDSESLDSWLTFSLDNTPAGSAGVSLQSNRYINISPASGWTGQTSVSVRVADSGGLSMVDSFDVNVEPFKTWNGSLSRDWHTAANWTPSGIPGSIDDVIIPQRTNQPILSSGDAAMNRLNIQSGAVLDLGSHNITVESAVTNFGKIQQSKSFAPGNPVNFLIITNLAATQTRYQGIELNPITEETNLDYPDIPGDTTATVGVLGNQFCPGLTSGVHRCFEITPSSPLTATVRFYFQESERYNHTLNDLKVNHELDGWAAEPGPYSSGGSGDAQYVTISNLNVSAHFALRPAGGGGGRLYLPLLAGIPTAPLNAPNLDPISNADNDGNYTVSWGQVPLSEWYELEEDDNGGFPSPEPRYAGLVNVWNATGKPVGTYYYRVRAGNSGGMTEWSATQALTIAPNTLPKAGFWTGYAEEFTVTADQAHVSDYAIYIDVTGCGSYKVTHLISEPITGNSFSFSGSFIVSGTFNSTTTAYGTEELDSLYISGCGYVSGGPYDWDTSWYSSNQVTYLKAEVIAPDTGGVEDQTNLVSSIK